jgi:hypothetical protein
MSEVRRTLNATELGVVQMAAQARYPQPQWAAISIRAFAALA